jgi:hypothetical protein
MAVPDQYDRSGVRGAIRLARMERKIHVMGG